MPIRFTKKDKQLLVSQNLENIIVYPFVNNFSIITTLAQISPSIGQYGDLCGYLTLKNVSELDGEIVCQHSIYTQQPVGIILKVDASDDYGPWSQVYYQLYTKDQSNSFEPTKFILNKIACPNQSKNNLVTLFIYAYNYISTSENSIDLAYFKSNIAI